MITVLHKGGPANDYGIMGVFLPEKNTDRACEYCLTRGPRGSKNVPLRLSSILATSTILEKTFILEVVMRF